MGYADGSTTDGYFVNDLVWYGQVSGNLATMPADASVTFGCGLRQTGNLVSSTFALDGLLGFGASSTSFVSQLASTGNYKKKFAHCLDEKGGGVFAMGDVVEQTLKTTQLLPNRSHYNVYLESLQVGNTLLDISKVETIVDSGTTLAYLPGAMFYPLRETIFASYPNLIVGPIDFLQDCFQLNESISDIFPTVTFGLENSVKLEVYPHQYLIPAVEIGWYCLGLQDSGRFGAAVDWIILGELALSNKLIVYDLENQVMGFTEYNCSSSIKMRDEQTGRIFDVASHDISAASGLNLRRLSLFFLLTYMLQYLIHYNIAT
ncbi:hypothetical protein MKW94_023870 [Papaver nudicaule]|uniref:Peptidase A1 domain-containing protein n=1 Tax=Papaver nudicaule TaxID=74823 RepID=A0AA41VZP2_PAPNU|nr:hypothetical protein [Papaver nudicaule]